MSWTDERIEKLTKMWEGGSTASQIAEVLGGVSRNAVIGKAHRLKLSSRLSPIQQNTSKKPKSEPQAPRLVKPSVRLPEFKGMELKLEELKERMCRWPNGDPREKEEFSFCGHETIAGLPYCDAHCRAAYQVPTRARTLDAKDFEADAGTPADFDIKAANAN
jgi:GcrA cell cycle regulator